MTMDLFALSRRRLGSIAEWQDAITKEGFQLRLAIDVPFLKLRGHLPAYWRGREAGFECSHGDVDELITTYYEIAFGHGWNYVLKFHFHTFPACAAVSIAAAAYARAADGIVFDPQDSRMMTPHEAARVARQAEIDVPRYEREFAERDRLRAERNPSA